MAEATSYQLLLECKGQHLCWNLTVWLLLSMLGRFQNSHIHQGAFSSAFFWLFLTCIPPYTRTHTLKDVWHQLNHTRGEEQMTGDRWPNPQQQMTRSFTELHFSVTCEILDEHTDCSRCTRWRADLRLTNWIQQNLWRNLRDIGGERSLFLHEGWSKTKLLRWITVVLHPCL